MRKCPFCGCEDNYGNFCTECGKRLPSEREYGRLQRLKVIGIIAIGFFLVGLYSIRSNNRGSSVNGNNNTRVENRVVNSQSDSKPQPVAQEKQYVPDNLVPDVYENARKYKGKHMKSLGKVIKVEMEKDGLSVQAFQDFKNSNNNTVIKVKNISSTVKSGDYILFDGEIVDKEIGMNLLGAWLTAPVVSCDDIQIISYRDAVSPPVKILPVEQSVTKDNFTLTIFKIEFAESETRVYAEFKNDSNEEFTLATYSATVVQDSKQYDVTYNYEANYEEMQTSVKPTVKTSGILLFNKMDMNAPMTIEVNGTSDSFESYKFIFEAIQ